MLRPALFSLEHVLVNATLAAIDLMMVSVELATLLATLCLRELRPHALR